MANIVMPFDQNQFTNGDAYGASFYEQGFYYAPPNCIDGTVQCRLHIFFHGCLMGYEYIGTEFIETAGLLEVAEANDIVMIFPTVSININKEILLLAAVKFYEFISANREP